MRCLDWLDVGFQTTAGRVRVYLDTCATGGGPWVRPLFFAFRIANNDSNSVDTSIRGVPVGFERISCPTSFIQSEVGLAASAIGTPQAGRQR